jgi:F-type H+-transporting ATPase subunit gamma
MEELERLSARLDNIRAVEPILAALRTIALGNRLLCVNKVHVADQYRHEIEGILALIPPLEAKRDSLPLAQPVTASPLALLVIGSERGLCGAFNDTVVAQAQQLLAQRAAAGESVTLMSLGKQTERALRRQGRLPVWSGRLSAVALPPFELAGELAQEWLDAYEKQELNAVHVVHNVRVGVAGYAPMTTRLLPIELPTAVAPEMEWPPIVETEPVALRRRLARLWLSAAFYGIMLESAAAEYSARYQLLEGAAQNARRMIEELETSLQAARQEAITAEVQNLSSGAGLVGRLADGDRAL